MTGRQSNRKHSAIGPADGVRYRIVVSTNLAERIRILAHETWQEPHEWIRAVLEGQAKYLGEEYAIAADMTPAEWWIRKREELPTTAKELTTL